MLNVVGQVLLSIPFIASAFGVFIFSHQVLYRVVFTVDKQQLIEAFTPWRLVFDITLAASFVVAELVLCEIGQWVDPDTRAMVWKLSVGALLICLAVAIPLLLISSLLGETTFKTKRTICFLLYTVFLLFFYYLGRFMPMETEFNAEAHGVVWWLSEQALSRIAFVGITAMGILSGFGAVSAPYIVFISRPRPISESDVERLARAVETTDGLISTKRNQLHSIQTQLRDRTRRSSTNIMSKFMTHFRGDELIAERKALETELGALENMRTSLDADLSQAKTRLKTQKYSQTPYGRVLSIFYSIFAVYCIYRLANNLILRNPFWNRSMTDYDALAVTLAHVANAIYPYLTLTGWIRQIGFTLSGVLFLTSISSVATTYNTLRKAFPWFSSTTTVRASTDGSSDPQQRHSTTGLLMAGMVGTYVISTSLMLRSNLPREMSSAITAALGAPLDVPVVQVWFDSIFIVTAIVSMVGLYIANRLQAVDDEAIYDEEYHIEKRD